MRRSSLLIQAIQRRDLKGSDVMETFTMIVVIVCMLIYTIYAVWQILQFNHIVSGVLGTAAVIAGGIGVYLIAPFIASLIIGLLEIAGAIIVLAVIFGAASE